MPPQRVVVSDELRYMIRDALQLSEKVRAGVVEMRVTPLGRSRYRKPYGTLPRRTRSEIVRYVIKDNGWELVKAHRYVMPGSQVLGPDPLYMRIGDAVFVREQDA